LQILEWLFCFNPAGAWVAMNPIELLTYSKFRCANWQKLAALKHFAGLNAPLH